MLPIQSNSVITNSTGPRKSVCNNCEIVITVKVYVVKVPIWDQKSGVIFVRYSREFVITVIVIAEFDCTLFFSNCQLPNINIVTFTERTLD